MRPDLRKGPGPVPVAIGVLLVVVVATFLAFTRELPFRSHYEVKAVVPTANQLKPGSFVRIAGVNVGKVTKVEPVGDGAQAARVTMRIDDKGRPVHKDARLKIRPRIVFEGNFFVDLQPGSPQMPELEDGETLPIQQASGPVQFDQVLGIFKADTRQDLKTVLKELNTAYSDGGAEAINRTSKLWAPAYRGSAIVNEAMLGENSRDLSRYLASAARVAEGLDRNPAQLQSLITDLRTTAAAFAREDSALEQGLGELPRTLRAGLPALAALNDALPTLRRFTADLRPGVRSSPSALDAQIPFVRELRGLVQTSELRGLTADLRPTVPSLARFNKATIPLLEQVRAASSCQNEVILPWTLDKIEDPDFPAIGPVYQEQTKPLVGLAGESRSFDANGQWFRVALQAGQYATPFGGDRFLLTDRPILGANPPKPAKRSPLRPDVACETQERPDLRTRQTDLRGRSFKVRQAPAEEQLRAQGTAIKWLEAELKALGVDTKVVDEVLTRPELPKLPNLADAVSGGKR